MSIVPTICKQLPNGSWPCDCCDKSKTQPLALHTHRETRHIAKVANKYYAYSSYDGLLQDCEEKHAIKVDAAWNLGKGWVYYSVSLAIQRVCLFNM